MVPKRATLESSLNLTKSDRPPYSPGATAIQMGKDWEKQFSEFLKRDNPYTKTQAVLLTSTSDDARERDVIDHSMRAYYGENVKFMNDKTIAYDPGRHELRGIPASDSDTEIPANGVLVVGTHGNIHWLFGDLPGGEKKAAEKFASNLHALEARYGLKLKDRSLGQLLECG